MKKISPHLVQARASLTDAEYVNDTLVASPSVHGTRGRGPRAVYQTGGAARLFGIISETSEVETQAGLEDSSQALFIDLVGLRVPGCPESPFSSFPSVSR